MDPLLAADLAGEGGEEEDDEDEEAEAEADEEMAEAEDEAGEGDDEEGCGDEDEEEEQDGGDDEQDNDEEEDEDDEGDQKANEAEDKDEDEKEDCDDDGGEEGTGDADAAPAKKRRGKPRDPNAPKKPLSPYYQFVATERQQAIEKNPALKSDLGALGKAMAQAWAQHDQGKKDEAQAVYDKEKQVYDKLMAEYVKTDSYHKFKKEFQEWKDMREMKKMLKKHKLAAPTRPPSGYMAFVKTVREELQAAGKSLPMSEAASLVARRWEAAGSKVQQDYNTAAKEAKAKWDLEMQSYRHSEAYRSASDDLSALEIKQGMRRLKAEYAQKLPRKASGAMQLFAAATAEKGTFSAMSARFKALPPEDQTKYNDQAAKLRAEAKEAQDAFFASPDGIKYRQLEAKMKHRSLLRAARKKFLVDAPRKPPTSAKVLFVAAPAADGSTRTAGLWAKLPEEEQRKWESELEQLNTAYEKKQAEFEATDAYKQFAKVLQKGAKGKGRGKAKAKAKGKAKAKAKAVPEGMPGKAPSAYMLFAKAKKGQITGGLTAISKAWNALTEEDKKPFLEQASAAVAALATEKELWAKSKEGKRHSRAMDTKKRKAAEAKAKAKYLRCEGAPETPVKPKKAKELFIEAKRAELFEKNPKRGRRDVDREALTTWSALSVEDRKPYEAKARALQDAYEFDLDQYKQTPAYKKFQKTIDRRKGRGGKGAGRGGRGEKRKADDLGDLSLGEGDSDVFGSDDDSLAGLESD